MENTKTPVKEEEEEDDDDDIAQDASLGVEEEITKDKDSAQGKKKGQFPLKFVKLRLDVSPNTSRS